MNSEQNQEQKRSSEEEYCKERILIARILDGDKECFYELIAPCEKSVYLTALGVLQNAEDAEEVAQESILKAFRNLSSFRGESRFATWLVTITQNEARMKLRKDHRNLWQSIDQHQEEENGDYIPKDFGDWREIPSEALERKEVRDILAKAVAALNPIYREVIILRDIRQFSISETADILEIGIGNVKTRLTRARLQLRDLVGPIHAPRRLFGGKLFGAGKKPWS